MLVVTLVTAPRESQGAEELPASWVVSQTGSSGLDGRTPCSRAKGQGGASGLLMGLANEEQWA